MIIGHPGNKALAVSILTKAYQYNDTINDTILQHGNRLRRLERLMAYSFDTAADFGKICFSDDGKAVALILFPDKQRITPVSILRDLHFLFFIAGPRRALRALGREKAVREAHTAQYISHIWYLATTPDAAGSGTGTALMQALMEDARNEGRPLYVESRIPENTAWYKKRGFEIYHRLEHDGRYWDCLRKDVDG